MATSQNFDNGTQQYNIHLGPDGALSFNANDHDGAGETRMVIDDDSGQVTIGGSDRAGRLRLTDSEGVVTIALRSDLGNLTLGAEGTDGDLECRSSSGLTTIDLDGERSTLRLFDSEGSFRTKRVDLDGVFGRLQLLNSAEQATADLRGDAGILTLGGADATDGDLFILDSAGTSTIECNGDTGSIECVSLIRAGVPLRTDTAPLTKALDSILAMRGVRYQSAQGSAPRATGDGEAQHIGFVDQEVAATCPDLVVTNAKGRTSVDYFRLAAVLVEAVKEQQQLLLEQAARISAIEAGLVAQIGRAHV